MDLQTLDLQPFGAGPWATPIRVAPETPPRTGDVVIVGAGLTGLSAALAIAERGVPVVVVDRQFGQGATSRSGGIILGDTLEGPAPGFHGCERTFGEWITAQQLVCGFRWTTCLELSHDFGLATTPIDWIDAGPVRVADRVPAAVVDPVQLLNGLLWMCRGAGVSLVSGLTVTGVAASNAGAIVVANQSEILARHVIMATDAMSWPAAHDPWTERTLTVALQTEPLSPQTPASLGLQPFQPFYTRELPLLWGRPLLDGSFVFGRELVAFPWTTSSTQIADLVAHAGNRLADRVRGLHPGLANIAIRRVWAGPTARTVEGVPRLVTDPTLSAVSWAGGYGGHGLAQAFTIGRRAAAHVLQELHAAR